MRHERVYNYGWFQYFLLDLKHKYSVWSVPKSRGLETKIKINFNKFYVLINSINSTTRLVAKKIIFLPYFPRDN